MPPRWKTSAASLPTWWCATAKARRSSLPVTVTGAVSDDSARKVGLAIANSPLVKTAIAGEDANWGRVVMAVGKAGEPADRDRLSIGFGGVWAARDGLPLADYDEAPVAAHLKGRTSTSRSIWAWAKAAPRCGPAT
jgi:N-acetylglutamate synthase/N-acetylornithine aminotransferase